MAPNSGVKSAPISSIISAEWLPHVSKDVSHNVKLNQLRADAQAARQHVHDPPALREKYAQFEAEHYSPPAAMYLCSPTPKPPLPAAALGNYHHYQRPRPRHDDDNQNLMMSPTKPPTPPPLPPPWPRNRDDADEAAIFADIREKERRIMQLEDERRRLELGRRHGNVH